MRTVAGPPSGNARNHQNQTNKTNNIMKKFILIAAAAIVASVGVSYAANSMLKVEDHSKCEGGTRCISCKGTGWGTSYKCSMCKGTGANSSY